MITDIRYALRMLAKNPAFACVVVLTLALGIGANAAIFSLLDKVLLQSLPVANPDQLVVLSAYGSKDGPSFDSAFSYLMYQDLRDRNSVFSGVIARGGVQMNVSYGDQTERVRAELVSGNFFEVLGVRPWAGRLFTQDDDRTPGAHPVAVLSYPFWERRFGKDPNLIGKTILVNEQPVTVLGVTPPNFFGTDLSNNPDVRHADDDAGFQSTAANATAKPPSSVAARHGTAQTGRLARAGAGITEPSLSTDSRK